MAKKPKPNKVADPVRARSMTELRRSNAAGIHRHSKPRSEIERAAIEESQKK